jgi:hypothetical protein
LGRFPSELDDMPYADYRELQEFFEVEPWGLPARDAMHAHAISVLAEINRDTKKRRRPFRTADFLLWPIKSDLPEPTVEGKTAEEWQLIFGAERLAAQRERERQQ